MCSPDPQYYAMLDLLLFSSVTGVAFGAYDLAIGIQSFFEWTKIKGLQSLKALGIIASALCLTGGVLYGVLPSLDIQGREMALGVIVTLICLFPMVEFALRKKRTKWDFIVRAPMALAALLAFSFLCFNVWKINQMS